MPHVKPTPEELQANAQKALEDAEALKTKEPEKEPEKQPEKDPEKQPEKDLEEDKSPEVDYKKKFIESTREAQILHAKNKKMTEAIVKAESMTDPTEEELRKEYSDWDDLTESQQKIAKQALVSSRRFTALSEVNKEFKDMEAWTDKVNTFIDDPKVLVDNQRLDGRQDEFKVFANKPTRRGVDFKDLVDAFLFNLDKEAPPKHKGQMFESGTGGPNDKGKKSDKLSLEEARTLRNTNYQKYREYLTAGKIESI